MLKKISMIIYATITFNSLATNVQHVNIDDYKKENHISKDNKVHALVTGSKSFKNKIIVTNEVGKPVFKYSYVDDEISFETNHTIITNSYCKDGKLINTKTANKEINNKVVTLYPIKCKSDGYLVVKALEPKEQHFIREQFIKYDRVYFELSENTTVFTYFEGIE